MLKKCQRTFWPAAILLRIRWTRLLICYRALKSGPQIVRGKIQFHPCVHYVCPCIQTMLTSSTKVSSAAYVRGLNGSISKKVSISRPLLLARFSGRRLGHSHKHRRKSLTVLQMVLTHRFSWFCSEIGVKYGQDPVTRTWEMSCDDKHRDYICSLKSNHIR